jgi:hypothetical protein
MKVAVLLPAILLAAGMAGAQDYLNCHFARGWEPSGTKRSYVSDTLYDYKDGGAEGYLIFGFVRMQGITCASGGNTLDIDVSQMADTDAAYGIFAANRDLRLPVVRIGMGGQVQSQSASFARGSYYVEIVEVASEPNHDDSTVMRVFATGIESRLQGRDTAPEALQWFPQEGLASVRLVPESVLGLKQLQRGYVATYAQGQAFAVQEASPQAATDTLKSLRERFDGATPAAVGDEAFEARAKYLDGVCIFRKGRYVAGYANLSVSGQAVALAAKLAARLP